MTGGEEELGADQRQLEKRGPGKEDKKRSWARRPRLSQSLQAKSAPQPCVLSPPLHVDNLPAEHRFCTCR